MTNDVLWKTGSILLLVFLLVPICREDRKTRTIPNLYSILLAVGGALLAGAHSLAVSSSTPFLSSAEGALAALGLGLLCRGIGREGFGWGDVKLLPGLGMALGLFPFLRAMAVTGVLSLIAAGYLLLFQHAKPSDKLPFAPFLAAGAVLSQGLELFVSGG